MTAVIAASVLSAPSVAQADSPVPKAGTASAAGKAPPPAEPLARGLIVKTKTSGTSVRGLAAASSAALAAQGDPDEVSIGPAVQGTTRLLEFAEPLPQGQAEAAAQVLAERIDVEWVVPDLPRRVAETPVIPNDPSFAQQWDMWDPSRANGGYSVKAPLVWGTTTGSSKVVVAIVDTGITDHPDLNANVVPGYDFVSDPAMANDGDGRDADPADPGDWVDQADIESGRFGSYCDSDWIGNSSWHGTHVAGTIAAIQDNKYGISGVAPGVRVQMVRALGKCGGYDFDIVAAITWAVGGHVSGVPDNPTPAQVVNMSLGGEGMCLKSYQDAVNLANSRGATVVVAAGNSGVPVTEFAPANCSGVVVATATGSTGRLAYYSNYGVNAGQVTLAAPGGDFNIDNGVYSTANSGVTVPGSPSVRRLQGTSRATPHVAGAAALLYSLGMSGSAVEKSLVQAVQPFPAGSGCTTVKCGVGILDLSLLSRTAPPSAPIDVMRLQTGATTVRVSWSVPPSGPTPSGYLVQASTDGGTYWVDTAKVTDTYADVTLKPGMSYRFRVAALTQAGQGPWSLITAPIELSSSNPPGAPTAVAVVPSNGRLDVSWQAPSDDGGSPLANYVVTVEPGRHLCTTLSLTCYVEDLENGREYTVTVTASNDAGLTSASSEPVTATPSATPGTVDLVTVRIKGTGSKRTAVITWAPPTDDGGAAVDEYRTRWKKGSSSYRSWSSTTTRTLKFRVRKGATYRVQIAAHNAAGYGKSKTVRVRF